MPTTTYTPLRAFPEVSRDPADIQKLRGKSPLGLDLEWDSDGNPTLLGLSDGVTHISVPYAKGRAGFLQLLRDFPATVLVGHNLVGADIQVLRGEGIEIGLDQIEDTIIRHWLTNMHLSKSSGKAALEEDEGEKKGRGFNNLGTMASLYTDFPHWKTCRDGAKIKPGKGVPAPVRCVGPCPLHDEPWYNGIDSAAPVIALPKLKRTMKLRNIEHLYPLHRELGQYLAEMSQFGVRIDIPYVEELRRNHEADKAALASELPFNPDSPLQVKDYFWTKHEVRLEDSQEQTVRDMVEELGEEAPDELLNLLDYKELGNGPDRWFKPYYLDKKGYLKGFMDLQGFVHPHIGYYTSSARMMCSSPNFQNVAKRRTSRKICECGHKKEEHGEQGCRVVGCAGKLGHSFKGESIGKKIRRAIIAPDGYYIVRADYSNAEGRTVLYHAGYESPKVDMHSWMRDNIGLKEDEPFSLALGGAREAAKSVTHASNYLEGLQLKSEYDLRHNPRLRKEIDEGARLVYWNWKFKGKVVTLTGVNLSRRAFGEASLDNRAKANQVVARYIDNAFPKIREWQQRVTNQIEHEGVVRPPHGYTLISYGLSPEDQIKSAVATWGQQPTAHISKLAIIDLMRRMKGGQKMRPVLQVHDEILTYVPESVSPAESLPMLHASMEKETPEMPGFVIPAEGSWGPNWKDQTKEGK